MKQFLKPEFKDNKIEEEKGYGRFELENLERGFGITLGNALRRVLLASIPGSAVYGVTIQGVRHEYSALDKVVEDPTMIILRLKSLVVKMDDDSEDASEILKLDVVGSGNEETVVTAKDIICPGGVHILNPDLVLAHVAPDGHLNMSIFVRNGRGYISSEENRSLYEADLQFKSDIGDGNTFPIPVDSLFSPILKVNYSVEPCRVDKRSDYDRLVLEVWTNGAIMPQSAVALASQIMIEHFNLFKDMAEASENQPVNDIFMESKADKKTESEEKPIEELDLSVRSYNCLKRAGISTVGELCNKTEEEMMKVRNLGKKSLKEVKEKLISLKLHFRNDNN